MSRTWTREWHRKRERRSAVTGKELWGAGRATPSPQAPSTTGWGWEATHSKGPPCPPVGRAAAPVGTQIRAGRRRAGHRRRQEGEGAAASSGRWRSRRCDRERATPSGVALRPRCRFGGWEGGAPAPMCSVGCGRTRVRCGGEIPMCSGVGGCGHASEVSVLDRGYRTNQRDSLLDIGLWDRPQAQPCGREMHASEIGSVGWPGYKILYSSYR